MPEISLEEYQKKQGRDALIIGIAGLILFLMLVLWGFKILLKL